MEYEVTIGIPVYNVEKYIRKTLESALAQTFSSIEFLVLDDCGTDASMDIVRDIQSRHPRGGNIRIVRQQKNSGIGNARNRIVEEAKGFYLYYLDADDTITPNAIELLYKNAQKYNADIVYGSYKRIEQFDTHVEETAYVYPSLQFLKEYEFANKVYSDYGFLQATTWNFLIRTDIYKKNGLRYFNINYWEDFLFTMDLPTYISNAVLLSEITYFYYCRYGSLSNFGKRDHIEKTEIQETINAIKQLKRNTTRIKTMPYFYMRMCKVMMTQFFMACSILKNKELISPVFSNKEIRDVMCSPLSFFETLSLTGWKVKNLFLYSLGVLPPFLSVSLIKLIGKYKGLI